MFIGSTLEEWIVTNCSLWMSMTKVQLYKGIKVIRHDFRLGAISKKG